MHFDFSPLAIHCIGPTEPALLVAVLVGAVLALLVGGPLGRVTASVKDPWRRWLYLLPVWGTAGLGLFVGVVGLTHWLYALWYRRVTLCTELAWLLFLIPPALLLWRGLRAAAHPEGAIESNG